jgi:hypothetical protein
MLAIVENSVTQNIILQLCLAYIFFCHIKWICNSIGSLVRREKIKGHQEKEE